MSYKRHGVSVLIADDHAATRKFLDIILRESGMRVVGEAENGHAAVQLCELLRPRVVVLDISMPDLNGFAAARQIARLAPATRIIFLSGYALKECVSEALRAGGAAFVSKDHAARDLLDAIEAALMGGTYVSGESAA